MGNVSSTDFQNVTHTIPASLRDADARPSSLETVVYRSAPHPEGIIDNLIDGQMSVAYDIFRKGKSVVAERPKSEQGFLGVRKRANCGDEVLGMTSEDGALLNEYLYLTYDEVDELARVLGTALVKGDLVKERVHDNERYPNAKKLRVLSISSRNRAEWFITDLCCQLFGFASCPLYETFGESSIAYILDQTKSSFVAGSVANLQYILNVLDYMARLTEEEYKDIENEDDGAVEGAVDCIATPAGAEPSLGSRREHIETFLSIDNHIPMELVDRATSYGIKCYTWRQIMELGRSYEGQVSDRLDSTHPHGVCSLCYTSGTTGVPKGVIITQKAFAADVSAALRGPLHAQGLDLSHRDIYMSYLPLAHVLERVLCAISTAVGAKLAIFSGDTRTLLDDIKVAEPTVFASVPRLFMRINDRIQSGLNANSAVVRYLFEKGIETKLKNLRERGEVYHPFWDALIFKRIKMLMGSRLRYMLSGGAALERGIQEKMACLFSCPLLEGYGLTETLGATFIRRANDAIYGHIGMPLPCVEVKLVAVPEMEYEVQDKTTGKDLLCPAGELVVRGYSVTPGYFLNPQATDEAFECDQPALKAADGREYKWFNTGDIAVRLGHEGGRFKIIDRKKNLFKMSQGEYIAPEHLENIYSQVPIISQIFVYGDSLKTYLVAIIAVEPEETLRWAQQTGALSALKMTPTAGAAGSVQELSPEDLEALAQYQPLKAFILGEMDHMAAVSKLKGLEKVKNIHLTGSPFTPENGLLTPTFKLRRNVANQQFADQIAALYQ